MPQSKKERPSSTPGKSKGENCHRSALKTWFAKDSRGYRTNPKQFLQVARIISKFKGNNTLIEVIEDNQLNKYV